MFNFNTPKSKVMPADSGAASELHQEVQEADLGIRGAAKRDGGG